MDMHFHIMKGVKEAEGAVEQRYNIFMVFSSSHGKDYK